MFCCQKQINSEENEVQLIYRHMEDEIEEARKKKEKEVAEQLSKKASSHLVTPSQTTAYRKGQKEGSSACFQSNEIKEEVQVPKKEEWDVDSSDDEDRSIVNGAQGSKRDLNFGSFRGNYVNYKINFPSLLSDSEFPVENEEEKDPWEF